MARHAEAIQAGVKPFELYCLRHTALSRFAESGCDAFTLARMAEHSSITITQRYCHPQADAIERAFGNLSGGHKIGHSPELPAKEESGKVAAPVVQRKDSKLFMAEREGFEPPVELPPRLISSQVHSATLPPLRSAERAGARIASVANAIAPVTFILWKRSTRPTSRLARWLRCLHYKVLCPRMMHHNGRGALLRLKQVGRGQMYTDVLSRPQQREKLALIFHVRAGRISEAIA